MVNRSFPLRLIRTYLSKKVCTSFISIYLNCLLYTDPLSVDQHLKVVREATWEVRAKWHDLGVELRVTMGKLQVRKCDHN